VPPNQRPAGGGADLDSCFARIRKIKAELGQRFPNALAQVRASGVARLSHNRPIVSRAHALRHPRPTRATL
jgi:hypothetical protein